MKTITAPAIVELAAALGIPPEFNEQGWSTRAAACPFVQHEHDHIRPAARLGEAGGLYCYKCGMPYSAANLRQQLGIQNGTTSRQRIKPKKKKLPPPIAIDLDLASLTEKLLDNRKATRYLLSRGVGSGVIQRNSLGLLETPHALLPKVWRGEWLLTPLHGENTMGELKLIGAELRSFQGQRQFFKIGSQSLFGLWQARRTARVAVVIEGKFDAMLVNRLIGQDVAIAGATGTIKKFADELLGFRHVLHLVDDDKAGHELEAYLRGHLRPGAFTSKIAPSGKDFGECFAMTPKTATRWLLQTYEGVLA